MREIETGCKRERETYPDNLLGDVFAGGSDSSDGQEHVVFEKVSGEHLNLLRKRCGEHESLSESQSRHIVLNNQVKC